ncbi:AAA domain-containing protein [Streptacidiphilus sp. ASG 303]|nr:AAA domain-containing protein [Streptacidiphilus sp. ASG 303]
MSPLVVSEVLPARQLFDVVIFDEASQVVPAEAIPAIMRAGQVVVAGDRRQLPPTSFFSGASEEEPEVSDDSLDGRPAVSYTTGYESVLDVLGAMLQVRSLTWHYRSRDERLIAFSNAWIYDSSLTTFPGVSPDGALSHVLVDQGPAVPGQERSGSAEVDRVVRLVIEHAEQRPTESLGVITMGIEHANRIEAAIRAATDGRDDLHDFFREDREERFFVKNLERVQGDERDAIILSVGYGKSTDGRMLYRFGPLNNTGGERRLNVAVTRARHRMTVVSSFGAHDMDPDRLKAQGAKLLRSYIEFAASGGNDLGTVAREKPALNPFEIDVRDRLTAEGIPLVAQWGVAGYWLDFAARHPRDRGRMVLAIEADGATYHSSATARDRDRLRQEQLERLGWTFHRIWSTAWFRDPEREVRRARDAYDRAVATADGASPSPGPAESVSLPAQRSGAGVPTGPTRRMGTDVPVGAPAEAGPARGRRPALVRGQPITAYSERQLVGLIRWIESDTLLRTEEELVREAMQELGFSRMGPRIRAALENAVRTARRPAR